MKKRNLSAVAKSLDRYELATYVLELLLQVVVFLSLVCAIYAALIPKEHFAPGKCFLVIIPVLAGYLARKYIKHFFTFILVHIVMIVAGVLIGDTDAETAINVVTMIVFMAYSITLKDKAMTIYDSASYTTHKNRETKEELAKTKALRSMVEGEKVPYVFVLFTVIGYLIGIAVGNGTVMEIELLLCCMFVVLQLFYNNMQSICQVYRINKEKANFPEAQMKRVNTFVMLVSGVAMLVAMLIFYNGEYGSIFSLTGNLLSFILKMIAKMLLFLLGIFGKESESGSTPVGEGETFAQDSTLEALPDNAYMEAIAEGFAFVMIALCVVGILYMIFKYSKSFRIRRSYDNDIIEAVEPLDEEAGREKGIRGNRVKPSREEKSVRRIYKKLVLRGTGGKTPSVTHTPSRLTLDNITKDERLASDITEIYEKARYSNETVTRSEIDILKRV